MCSLASGMILLATVAELNLVEMASAVDMPTSTDALMETVLMAFSLERMLYKLQDWWRLKWRLIRYVQRMIQIKIVEMRKCNNNVICMWK